MFWRWYWGTKDLHIKQSLEALFKKSYGNFFFSLTKKEKRTLLKEMPFLLALAAFKAIWEIFPSSREGFTRSFCIKVIKLWYYIVQGISVSSIFIENKIEKYLVQTPQSNPWRCSQLVNVWTRWFLSTLDPMHEMHDNIDKTDRCSYKNSSIRGSSVKGLKLNSKVK